MQRLGRIVAAPVLLASLSFAQGRAAIPASGEGSDEAKKIAAAVDPLIRRTLAKSGMPGAAFVFVRRGHIVYQAGYGAADAGKGDPVDPALTVWPVASITKVVTALAAMQLVDQGRVDLDTDVNRYLRRLQIPAKGYGPLTLRQLLSHTGGLDEIPGRRFDGTYRPDMAAFLKDRLVRYRAPGKLTAYSSYGIALVGVLIEDVTGKSYADYVREHIFGPAGMKAWIMTMRGEERGLATAYELEDGKAQAIPYEWYVTTPTSSMVASASDMGRLLTVFLGKGRGQRGARILSPGLTTAMLHQQATVHPKLPGWGLGFQIDRVNGLTLAEHGGDIAGFSSLFVLMPELDAGFYIVHHGESGNLRFEVKQAVIDALRPEKELPPVPKADPKKGASLKEYAGRYLSSLACHTCPPEDDQVFEVKVDAEGTLSLWGQKWVPVRRDLFIREDGRRYLGFAREANGRVVAVTGGSWRVADKIY
jgi:CubicO group peptidase (beta-lactamase class C family)